MKNYRTHILKNDEILLVGPAVPEDTPDVMEFCQKAFADDPSLLVSYEESPESFTLESIWRRISRYQQTAAGLFLLAVADDAIIGLAEAACEKDSLTPYIARVNICVLPAYRGLGVGAAMMYSLIGWARNNPAVEILTLSVASDNPAARMLYEKLGFQEEGQIFQEAKLSHNSWIKSVMMYKFVK